MSPKNRKKLEKIRKKLDRLDNEFLRLIKIRTDLVNKVTKLKEFKSEIVDTKSLSLYLNYLFHLSTIQLYQTLFYFLLTRCQSTTNYGSLLQHLFL